VIIDVAIATTENVTMGQVVEMIQIAIDKNTIMMRKYRIQFATIALVATLALPSDGFSQKKEKPSLNCRFYYNLLSDDMKEFGSNYSPETKELLGEIDASEYEMIKCQSTEDRVIVSSLKVNRGNCPISNGFSEKTFKFGQQFSLYVRDCRMIEFSAIANGRQLNWKVGRSDD